MPCYQQIVYNVDFNIANVVWLLEALKSLDIGSVHQQGDIIYVYSYAGTIEINTKENKISGPDTMVSAIKEAYAKTAINKQIKMMGWQVKWTSNNEATIKRIRYG